MNDFNYALASASPLYQRAPVKLKPAMVWGLLVALALHLALAAYLITQTIAPIAEAPPAPEDIIKGGVITLAPRVPEPDPTINVHKPENPLETKVPPLPATPQDNPQTSAPTTPRVVLPTTPAGTAGPETTGTSGPGAPAAVAKWSRFPGPEALSEYFPPRALDAEVEGTASVECVVRDLQGRVSCRVLSEQPGGYGFGEATRRMIEKIGRVEVSQSNLVVGSTLRLSVKWNLPQ